MKNLIEFFKSKTFVKHLAIALGSFALIIFLVFQYLDFYTDHDEFILVPDFSSVHVDDLETFIESKNVRYKIIDSVFMDKGPKGVVVRQDPIPHSKVKEGRVIYLYVSSRVPQQVSMPNLVDASPRQALALLEAYGLKLAKIESKPGPNAVLAQYFENKSIAPGTLIPKGSRIVLWIGEGEGDQSYGVPCLKGLTLAEARNGILENNLAEGAVICVGCKTREDSLQARGYKQNPACQRDNLVPSGTSVDIFLTLNPKLLGNDSVPKNPKNP